jgi:PelA/Pel-15E family pectate lyase
MGLVKITFFVVLLAATASRDAVIGASAPAQSIAAARIAQLPKARQAAWRQYLDRSAKRMEADRTVLRAELKAEGLAEAAIPSSGSAARSMPLGKPPEWYGSAEARRIADGIVSFQTPAGGWSKNLNVADHVRRKGESFAPNNLSHFLGPDDFDTPADPHWNYVGTLDNDATTTELQFLAKVIGAVQDNAAYRASFLRGVEYLFAAQFPNGGWPQVWPLEGGYRDAITFNDGAVTETLELLQAVAERKFPFVPAETAKRAPTRVARGIDCILNTQITENGKRTVWGQQHDALTLQPVAGRNYEPAAECRSESASMILFLMISRSRRRKCWPWFMPRWRGWNRPRFTGKRACAAARARAWKTAPMASESGRAITKSAAGALFSGIAINPFTIRWPKFPRSGRWDIAGTTTFHKLRSITTPNGA